MKLELVRKKQIFIKSQKKKLELAKKIATVFQEDWYLTQDVYGNTFITVFTPPFMVKQFHLNKLLFLDNTLPLFVKEGKVEESRDKKQVLESKYTPKIVKQLIKDTGSLLIGVAQNPYYVTLLLGNVVRPTDSVDESYITLHTISLAQELQYNDKNELVVTKMTYDGMESISLYQSVAKKIVDEFIKEDTNERGTNNGKDI